jgi:hypothetical protein
MLQRTSGWSTKNTGVHEHANPNKCAFGISAGQLLGFLIHERRIEVGQKSISAIDKIEAPSNKKELQLLMDMINFIRRFICNLSEKNSVVHNFVEVQGRSKTYMGRGAASNVSKMSSCPNAPSRQEAIQIIFIG